MLVFRRLKRNCIDFSNELEREHTYYVSSTPVAVVQGDTSPWVLFFVDIKTKVIKYVESILKYNFCFDEKQKIELKMMCHPVLRTSSC